MRYYNSSTGRFVSEDPLGFKSGDLNLYRYVGNKPLTLVDPDGQAALLPGLVIIGGGLFFLDLYDFVRKYEGISNGTFENIYLNYYFYSLEKKYPALKRRINKCREESDLELIEELIKKEGIKDKNSIQRIKFLYPSRRNAS